MRLLKNELHDKIVISHDLKMRTGFTQVSHNCKKLGLFFRFHSLDSETSEHKMFLFTNSFNLYENVERQG